MVYYDAQLYSLISKYQQLLDRKTHKVSLPDKCSIGAAFCYSANVPFCKIIVPFCLWALIKLIDGLIHDFNSGMDFWNSGL